MDYYMDTKWYKKSYRRNLVDMHIDEWNKEFLSRFEPDAYFQYLMDAKVDSAMLYLQSHIGLCYFPTKSGKMHNAFKDREDAMRRLAEKCRENGIAVVGYYSLIFNTYEEERHPEWRLITDRKSGTSDHQRGSRYGKCCPNNPEYREFLKDQISEIADYFTLDGVFYDMTFWPGVCYCEHCRKRFEAETGLVDLPDMENLKSLESMMFLKKRYEWISEFAGWITDYTRAIMPGVTVSHNNAYEVSGDWHQASWEGISDCSEYCTGDLYGDIYDHSFCMKYYLGATQNMPFEYMVSRFAKNLSQHTMSKTETELTKCTMLTVAHRGANFVIDAIDPVGTVNPDIGRLIGRAFEKQIPYEKYMYGNIVSDVAVWYSATGRYNSEGQEYNNRTCSSALSKTLTINHVPFSVMADTASKTMDQYRLVMAPDIAGLDDANRNDIYEYVSNGGSFYFSGTEEPRLLEAFFDAFCEGYTAVKSTYVAPVSGITDWFDGFSEKYPLTMTFRHPMVKIGKKDTVILAKLKLPYGDAAHPERFASIHSDPPGILTEYPSVVRVKYGKGTVIWSALPIEFYSDSYHHRNIIMRLVGEYLPLKDRSVITDAPGQIELVTFKDKEGILISAVDLGVDEERRKPEAFSISVRTERKTARVCLLPDERNIEFRYENGRTVFTPRRTDIFDMYRIEY